MTSAGRPTPTPPPPRLLTHNAAKRATAAFAEMRLAPTAAFPRVGVAVTVMPARLVRGRPVIDASRTLLVRRGTPPGVGLWCYPGGKLEAGETVAIGAAREVLEETGLAVTVPAGLAGFCASDVLDMDPSSGALRFHYTLAHVLAYVLVDSDGVPPHPTAASDAAAVRWVTLAGSFSGGSGDDAGTMSDLDRLGLLVANVADVSTLAVAQWGVRGFAVETLGAAVAPSTS